MEHLLQFLCRRRRKNTHAGDLGEQGHVVHAVVAGPVVAGDSRTVETENHGQLVQRDVVDDLVPCAREERAVHGDHRTKSRHRHARRSRDRVLFGDTDVEETLGESALEWQQAGGSGHRGRDGDDARVDVGFFQQCIGEGLRVAGENCLWRAALRVEHRRVVEVLFVVVLGGRVTTALLCDDVQKHRSFGGPLFGRPQRTLDCFDIVSVDGADVAHTERLEESRGLKELAHRGLHCFDAAFGLTTNGGQIAEELLDATLAAHVRGVQSDVGERRRQLVGDLVGEVHVALFGFVVVGRACRHGELRDRRRITAAVVVQHDDDAASGVTEVVQRFVREAARHRAVADDRNDVSVVGRRPVVQRMVARHGHAVRVRQHGRRVAVLDEVVAALAAAGVTRQALRLTQTRELGGATRDQLVHVGLVSGVPQNRIGGTVENTVQGKGEFDRTEVRTEVATRFGNGLHDEVADLAGEVVQLFVRQSTQVARSLEISEFHGNLTLSPTEGARGTVTPCRCPTSHSPARRPS